MKKQILAMFLAILMFSAVGCRNTESDESIVENNNTITEEKTEILIDPTEADDLPVDCKDYEGTEFVVMFRDRTEDSETWKTWDVYTEELNGERINDAVFERNLAILERFGVQVAELQVRDRLNTAKNLIMSGDNTFDLFQDIVVNQGQLAVQGYVLNMSDMDYIDFSKVWWDSSVIDGISIGDNVYYSVGASQLNAMKATWVVLFNKTLTSQAGITDLYETVKDNKWTLELLNQYGQQAAQDLNGDGKMAWGDDIFGIGLQHEVVVPLILGGEEKLFDIMEDGSFINNMSSSHIIEGMEKVHAFMNSGNHILNAQLAGANSDNWEGFRGLFKSDLISFYMAPLTQASVVSGDMQSDFGILPFPKLSLEQDEYYSTFQYNNADAISVPKNCVDTKRVGLLTEAYEMYAHTTIKPAYYDYTLTLRNARDTDSGEMLDIIFAARNFDISMAFNSTTKLMNFLQDNVISSTFQYASKEIANRNTVEKAISDILEAVASVGE